MLFISLRPKQWIKNLVVFAGLIFSHNTFNWELQAKVWLTLIAFCALVSAGYLVNDVLDKENDQYHPSKKNRPIASGRLSISTAIGAAVGLLIISLAIGALVDLYLLVSLLGYLVLQLSYAYWLKHVVILDVLLISAGFVLRAVAGAAVIHVNISAWLVVCAMLLALFLALAKRRAELVLLESEAANHRQNLAQYSVELVNQMISVTASSALVSYALYSFTAYESKAMMLTIPFVLFGIFRYLYLIHEQMQGGAPEQVLLTDIPLLIDIVLWAGLAVAVLQWMKTNN